jgi:dTDP-4-amino-4,6-dideoxy-D-galactose acyltransferase
MPDLLKFLAWDTDFFGVRIGRANVTSLDEASVTNISGQAESLDIACIYLLLDADDMASMRIAEAHGYRLVDIRVTLDRKLAPEAMIAPEPPAGIVLRSAEEKDLDVLQGVAESVYVQSRFYNDPHFSNERSAEMYGLWLSKSITTDFADGVRVADIEGKAVGYVTYHLDKQDNSAKIGLVGVAEEARGKQIGTLLLQDTLWQMAQANITAVQVVTQGSNIGAQRLYQRAGFLTRQTQLWYHKWRRGV